MWGYELAEFEKELIFRRENTGFVTDLKFVKGLNTYTFRLAPSPFLEPKKNELFVLDVGAPVPKEDELIEVEVTRVEKVFKRGKHFLVKLVSDWKKLDVKEILGRRPIITYEDFLEIVIPMPFKKLEDHQKVAIAVYFASTPPLGVYKGGILGIAMMREQTWYAYRRLLSLIPREFKSSKSKYYYSHYLGKVERLNLQRMRPQEISVDYINPTEPTYFHIPQALLNCETKRVSSFERYLKEARGAITAYMLQYLCTKPTLPRERYTVKKLEEVITDVKLFRKLVIPPDMSFVQRVPVAIARLQLRDKPKKEDMEETFSVWLDNYEEMLRHVSQPYDFKEYYKLTEDERKLYNLMVDLSENDLVKRSVLFSAATKIFDRITLDHLLSELHRKGFIIITKDSDYMLVSL